MAKGKPGQANQGSKLLATILSYGGSAAIAGLALQPYQNLFNAAVHADSKTSYVDSARELGFKGLYRGVGPGIFKTAITYGISGPLSHIANELINKITSNPDLTPQESTRRTFIAVPTLGLLCGGASATLTIGSETRELGKMFKRHFTTLDGLERFAGKTILRNGSTFTGVLAGLQACEQFNLTGMQAFLTCSGIGLTTGFITAPLHRAIFLSAESQQAQSIFGVFKHDFKDGIKSGLEASYRGGAARTIYTGGFIVGAAGAAKVYDYLKSTLDIDSEGRGL